MADGLQLSVSHLGYLPSSPKTATLVGANPAELPERIPYYIRENCFRMPGDAEQPEGFTARFPSPYDLLRGKLIPREDSYYRRGELQRIATRWGAFWQADFTDFRRPGTYQIEIDQQMSAPFAIQTGLYDRLVLGYLRFLHAQRCGQEVYGVHPACHLDDGVLDEDGRPWPATGGWHDAGDFRKWLAFTQGHLEALAVVYEKLNPPLPILDEIAWGNRFFHRMIADEGQVFEDVAGGAAPPGSAFTYEQHWWFENHPGAYGDAADNRWTDNQCNSGDERKVRTAYNPFVQFTFVHNQARLATILTGENGARCRELARGAWNYGKRRGHDGRTLFAAAQLRAALELQKWEDAEGLARELIRRQDVSPEGLSGYFLEKDGLDAYRAFAFSVEPAIALLRFWEAAAGSCGGAGGRAIYLKLSAGRRRQQSVRTDALRRVSQSADARKTGFSRCRARTRRADVSSSVQRPGPRPRRQRRADEPCAPPRPRRALLLQQRLAGRRRATVALDARPQHGESLALHGHWISPADRLLVPHRATARGDGVRLRRAS